MNTNKTLFIVGNSRSGTTMLMRIFNNHSEVHSINEPHFFEKNWSNTNKENFLDKTKAIELFSSLLFVQREGQHKEIDLRLYFEESKIEVDKFYTELTNKVNVYDHFLFYETKKSEKSIPCEKTPQNIFYVKEILNQFPNAKIINLVRDPRSVLLSQKKKWKRRSLGANFLSTKELIRLRINYHPITISKLWNSSLQTAKNHDSLPAFISIKYEDLLSNPEETLITLCNFIEMPFQKEMLAIPRIGSSSEKDDPTKIGIRSNRVYAWKEGGLNKSEIYICEKMTKKLMKANNYSFSNFRPNIFQLSFYLLSFPLKLVLALCWNLNRISSVKDTIRRRFVQ